MKKLIIVFPKKIFRLKLQKRRNTISRFNRNWLKTSVFSGNRYIPWLLLLLIIACADRTWDEDRVSLRLDGFQYPATVVLGFSELYQLAVDLSGQLPEDEVHCTLIGQTENIQFQLSDDGALVYPDSSLLVPEVTGDNVPGDGLFTRMIELGALAEGQYTLEIEVLRDDQVKLEETGIFQVAEDNPPLVEVLEYPDSLYSGFESAILLFNISDPDPGDEIVLRELIDLDLPLAPLSLTQLDDTLAFLELDHTFGANRSGLRTLVARAIDTPGLIGPSDTFQVWVGNNPPQLSQLIYFESPLCDTSLASEELELSGDTLTINLPSEGFRCFDISMEVNEEQGILDIDHAVCWIWDISAMVYLSQPLNFADMGVAPDTVAHDAVFSAGFHFAPPPINNPDEYIFEIHAVDKIGQHSDTLATTVIVLAPEAARGDATSTPCNSLYPNPFAGGER